MKILSINTSKIKTVEYQGKSIKTGFFKTPCPGPITIGTVNIDGDQQADLINHGGESKAVYGFSYHHYDFWQTTLGIEKLNYGAFGENLTLSHLDEDDICLGDQIRCGRALLEVSQPRVPCFKFAMAFNNSKAPKLFIDHLYTGVYFRVIETGLVNVNDELTYAKRADNSVSIKTLFQAFFDKSFNHSKEILLKAYHMKQLSNEWKLSIKQKLKL